jgi:hypothetical protein
MISAIGKNIDQAAASLTITSCGFSANGYNMPPDLQLDL